jgi:hypothetical protein
MMQDKFTTAAEREPPRPGPGDQHPSSAPDPPAHSNAAPGAPSAASSSAALGRVRDTVVDEARNANRDTERRTDSEDTVSVAAGMDDGAKDDGFVASNVALTIDGSNQVEPSIPIDRERGSSPNLSDSSPFWNAPVDCFPESEYKLWSEKLPACVGPPSKEEFPRLDTWEDICTEMRFLCEQFGLACAASKVAC